MNVIDLANDYITKIKNLSSQYESFIKFSDSKLKENEAILNDLNMKSNKLLIDLKRYTDEINKVNLSYDNIHNHLNEMKKSGSGYDLLDIEVLELMLKNAATKKESISREFSVKIDDVNKELATLKKEISDAEINYNIFNEKLPSIKSEYDKINKEAEKAFTYFLNRVNNYIDTNKDIFERFTPHFIEDKDDKIEILSNVNNNVDELKKEIVKEPRVIKNESSHNIDYPGIEKMLLKVDDEELLKKSMSSTKFKSIINTLKAYDIYLEEAGEFVKYFINIDNPENLENVLNILQGLGKNNNNLDLSSMLDVIFEADEEIIKKNLLFIYARGEDPNEKGIQLLCSKYYIENIETAEKLNIKNIEKKHPILLASLNNEDFILALKEAN